MHTHTHTLRANQTFDALRKEHASDIAVANANVKKLQLQVASLEKALKGKVGGRRERDGVRGSFTSFHTVMHTGPGERRTGSDM